MKVYLAGVISHSYSASGIYHLESFYDYYNSKTEKVLEKGKGLLIDSGAFTFMNAKAKGASEVNLDDYSDRYIEFLKNQPTDYFFELDVDVVRGIKYVEKIRRKIESRLGKPTIPVWHKSRGIDYFKGLCRDYSYISIGGIVTNEINRSEFPKLAHLVDYAHSHNCKIHGLGFTAMTWLSKIHWDSVDSTNFVNGTRFGTIYYFDPIKNNMTVINKPEGKRIKTNKGKWLNYHNFQEWIKFQKYAESNL